MNKHLEKAERYLQKGKLENALEELLLARKDEPKNESVVQSIADIYQRLNKLEECRQCYGFLFDIVSEKGEASRAADYIRKMQRLGAVEPRRLLRCAQLTESISPSDAEEFYRQVLQTPGSQDPQTALQCYVALARFQPNSLENHLRSASLALKLGKKAIAIASYQRIGELRAEVGRFDEAVEAMEEALRLSSNEFVYRISLAAICAKAGRSSRVIELLSDVTIESNNLDALRLLADANFKEKNLSKAEPIYWKLLDTSPNAIKPIIEMAIYCLQQNRTPEAISLLRKIEEYFAKSGREGDLRSVAEKISTIEFNSIPVLEHLTRLFDRFQMDTPLGEALHRLFPLYFESNQFDRAVELLERLIQLDQYDPGTSRKLDQLNGKIDPGQWKDLASRMGRTATTSDMLTADSAASDDPGKEPTTSIKPNESGSLTDLMLQAEIFLQYNLADKAKERLERIAKLFPGEEEANPSLRELYEKAGIRPLSTSPAASSTAQASSGHQGDIRAFLTRVSDISRNLSRQGNVKNVLSTAVNEIGKHWLASRCVIGLGAPGRSPSMVLEFISSEIPPSDPAQMGKLVMGLQQILSTHGSTLVADNLKSIPKLAPLAGTLSALQVKSLVALPLRDSDQQIGILILEQCEDRIWKSGELAGLEALSEQIVLSVSNVRLRNLMKALAVTDEESGMLHRDSYIPCLLAEAERMQSQKNSLTCVIIDFSPQANTSSAPLPDSYVKEITSSVVTHLRQNDIAIKYGPFSLAMLLPGTLTKDASAVVDKLRKLTASRVKPLPAISAAVAEAVKSEKMEAADVVTELINRLEFGLELARRDGKNQTSVLNPPHTSS
ncbi:MAG: hypothetical protein A3F68_02495 [Acidobacteria bacterium RIFCSPLOWO2_12_FULL_54_10]|nr:MAG: hypothetical protein A3F68_02495 [Acidobacteria bacterium RIFCSPLOWO2_12_FULL_54_10]